MPPQRLTIGPGGRIVKTPVPTKFESTEQAQASVWQTGWESSNVHAICWRPETPDDGGAHGVGVWFRPVDKTTGKVRGKESVYFYHAPFDTYLSMKRAGSKGTFVHEVLIPRYAVAGPFKPGV